MKDKTVVFIFKFCQYYDFTFSSENGGTHTYLDHFLLCSRNPTNPKAQTAMGQSCMSKGGIPVQPYFALGGYNGSNYAG